MRKFITFLIVMLIQIGIIYALYRWYVSYDSNSLNTKEEVTAEKTVQNNKVKNTEKNSNSQKQVVQNNKVQKNQPIIKKVTNTNTTPKQAGSPLIYKNAIWGDIPSLKRSKMARTGILVDIDNRMVLWAKQCRKSVPIASMTKMLTVLMAFESIDRNEDVSLDTVIPVTVEAYKIGGSQVYLDPREEFPLRELLKTIMISSANDSAFLIAQYLGGGDVNVFVEAMNERAKELGMINAHFSNPDGLPEKYSAQDNKATAEGLVFLAEKLLTYKQVVNWATTSVDEFRTGTEKPMMLVNTNRLVRDKFDGITGMKTGYIRRSGFCLTATCERNGQRLAAVITGFPSWRERNAFMKNLLNWGYKRLATLEKKN